MERQKRETALNDVYHINWNDSEHNENEKLLSDDKNIILNKLHLSY